MCNPKLKPNGVSQCNTKPCPQWKTGEWSHSCDRNCKRNRQVTCTDYISTILYFKSSAMKSNRYFSVTDIQVNANECDQLNKPESSTNCKLSECPHVNKITKNYIDRNEKGNKGYRWKVGRWKQVMQQILK